MQELFSFVAIDLGATSGRVMLSRFESGKLTLDEVHRFPNAPVSYNGELHWNMPGIWQQIRYGLDALASYGAPRIDAIGVDGWGVDYALLGESGVLMENPYHYRDARTEGLCDRICGMVGRERIYRQTGIQFMPINTLYQIFAQQQRTPRLLAAADQLLTIPDLVNYWLTGVIACEFTNASTTQFLSIETRYWAKDLLEDLGIPTHFLTRIVQPGTILGPLLPCISSFPALSGTVVVVPACHDTGSAVASIHCGVDTAFLSSGTWSLLGAEVAAPVTSSAARDLNFTNEGGVCGTTRLLKNITGLWLLEECRHRWLAEGSEFSWPDLLHSATTAAPARSLIDPDSPAFARPGNMVEQIDRFCKRTNQPVPRTKGEYVRAILESLALKYRMVLEQLESVSGLSFSRIRIIGGGAKNNLLNQYTADATRRTVLAGPVEATALGNVAMQMLACGAVKNLDEARGVIDLSNQPVHFYPGPACGWESNYRNFLSIVDAA